MRKQLSLCVLLLMVWVGAARAQVFSGNFLLQGGTWTASQNANGFNLTGLGHLTVTGAGDAANAQVGLGVSGSVSGGIEFFNGGTGGGGWVIRHAGGSVLNGNGLIIAPAAGAAFQFSSTALASTPPITIGSPTGGAIAGAVNDTGGYFINGVSAARSYLMGQSGNATFGSGTVYMTLVGFQATSVGSEVNTQSIFPNTGTTTTLRCSMPSDPGVGQVVVITVRKNAATPTGAQTCTITGGSGSTCSDVTHSTTWAAGDAGDYQIAITGTVTSDSIRCSVELDI